MNATLQAMRAIPELQTALTTAPSGGLPGSLNTLYTEMSKTTSEVNPIMFLTALRQAFPQFAEIARGPGAMKGGYAQQGEIFFRLVQYNGLTYLHLQTRKNAGSS